MEETITQYIQAILQRDPVDGEVEGYLAQINLGATPEDVINALVNGAEAVDVVYTVVRAYQAVYGRVPDAGGLDYWVDNYRIFQSTNPDNPATDTVNESTLKLLTFFVDPVLTPEFVTRFGANPSANAFVDACYRNVLNREPDQVGLNYWEGVYSDVYDELDAANPSWTDAQIAQQTRAIILEQFVNSAEYITRSDLFMQEFLHDAATGEESFAGQLWEKYPYDVEVADQTIAETNSGNNKVVTITVAIDKPAEGDLVLNYHTVNGTATGGNDYVTTTGTVTIEDGQTSATIQITILGDNLPEDDETFSIVFDTPYAAVETATVTIIDNDPVVVPLTDGIDLFLGDAAGGPRNETYVANESTLDGGDSINGGGGDENTLWLSINDAFTAVGPRTFNPVSGQITGFSIYDYIGGGNDRLAEGMGALWSNFNTQNVQVLVVSNSDETLFGDGSAWDVTGNYGSADFTYGSANNLNPEVWEGGVAIVDVDGMQDLETVVLFQQNGTTMIRDLQASHLDPEDPDRIHIALIDLEGFQGSGGDDDSGGNDGDSIYMDDLWWTCCDEEGMPRQIAAAGDAIIDWDIQATRGFNSVNILASEVILGNLWLTQNADNRNAELAEVEEVTLIVPETVSLPGSLPNAAYEGAIGEPVLINRIFASSTMETLNIVGSDVTEAINGGEPDSVFDVLLGIPWIASEDAGFSDEGDPWGIDEGLPGLTVLDASTFEGDLFVAFQYAVGMTITGGSGDDDFYINIGDYFSESGGWWSASGIGLLSGTTLDGGPGEDALWLPMYQFQSIGSDNVIRNVEQICFYGWIGNPVDYFRAMRDSSDTLSQFGKGFGPYNGNGPVDDGKSSESHEFQRQYVHVLDLNDLGIEDPETTTLVFDGPIGYTFGPAIVFDNMDAVLNVEFNNLTTELGWEATRPVLVFIPETDDASTKDGGYDSGNVVNVAFGDQTMASTYVVITDGSTYEVWDTATKTYVEHQDAEIDTLNIQLGTDCFEVNCLHVALDDMFSLDTITITDGPDTGMYQIGEYESMWPYGDMPMAFDHEEGYDPSEYPYGSESESGDMLDEGPKSFAIGTVAEGVIPTGSISVDALEGEGQSESVLSFPLPVYGEPGTYLEGHLVWPDNTEDTPELDLFDASQSSANIDLWLGSDQYRIQDNTPLVQLEFQVVGGADIMTGTGNDRVIDGAGGDRINSGDGSDLVIAYRGGDDIIISGPSVTAMEECGDKDVVVGGAGDDAIYSGDDNDVISGDGFGWILALLNTDCLEIDCNTAANLLDFFCCQYNECFKDGWAPEWLVYSTVEQQTSGLSEGSQELGYCEKIPFDEGMQEYLDPQIDNEPSTDVILNLCDIADALRTGVLDLFPYSSTDVVDFDCCDPAVWDFVIRVLDDVLTDIGLIPDINPETLRDASASNSLDYVLSHLDQYLDVNGEVAGDDYIEAGDGNDTVHGGGGTDYIFGQDGNDFLVGGDNDGDIRDDEDSYELIDGGADADMMMGGGIHAPGTPDETILGTPPSSDVWRVSNLDAGEGDTITVTVRYDANDDGDFDDAGEVFSASYTASAGDSPLDIAAGLAAALDAAEDAQPWADDLIEFSSGVNANGGFIDVVGPASPNNGDSAQEIELSASVTDVSVSVTTFTLNLPNLAGADGDSITIILDPDGAGTDYAATSVTFTVSLNHTTGFELAEELKDLIEANTTLSQFFSVSTSTSNAGELIIQQKFSTPAASVSASMTNTAGQGTATWFERELSFTGLDSGDTLTITLNNGVTNESFTAVVSGSTVEEMLQSYIDSPRGIALVAALNNESITPDGARLFINGTGNAATLIVVDDIEEQPNSQGAPNNGYDIGAYFADPADSITGSIGPDGEVEVHALGPLVLSNIPSDTTSSVTVTVTTTSINEDTPTATVSELADSQDGVSDEFISGIPEGTDGSDLFVVQTGTSDVVGLSPYGPDGVQADTYRHGESYEGAPSNSGAGLVNMIDHICDFWSILSPVVTQQFDGLPTGTSAVGDHERSWYESQGAQAPDQIAFKDFDGTPLDFGGTAFNYAEYHNTANTYEDALAQANNAMANGTTKFVAVSYNLGLSEEDASACGIADDVFDFNENFLVVFADTNDDNIADTAVRLSDRDNVNLDFHWDDIVAYPLI